MLSQFRKYNYNYPFNSSLNKGFANNKFGILQRSWTKRNKVSSVLLIYSVALIVSSNFLNLVNSSEVPILLNNTAGNQEASKQQLPPSIRLSVVNSGIVEEVISEKANETIVIPVNKYLLSEGQDVPTRVLRFDCTASYPVDWNYSGTGAPFYVISRSFRHIKNFSDPTTYNFSALIDLTKNDELNTGKYTCTSILKNRTENSYFKLYVPGEKLFLSDTQTVTKLKDNDTNFIIPCLSSNTRVAGFIKLYKEHESGAFQVIFPSIYDPDVGFSINLDPTVPITEYKGTYFCKDIMSSQTSVSHKIIPPQGSYVRVNPNTNFVKIIPGIKQAFICAAKENVTLTFSGDRQPRIVDFERNPSSEFPYLAIFEINPTNISAEYTVINCVTANDEILHTWEYSTYEDVSVSKFYFDSQKRYQDARYICCSNSFYKPKLEYIFCRTETECRLKRFIFNQDKERKVKILAEYTHRISYLNNTCVKFNPYLKFTLPTGLLRCSVNGVNKSFFRDYMFYFNPYRIYQAFTDDVFDAEKVISSDSIMKLSKTPAKNILVGQRQRFLCYYSELFLSNGIVWAIEMNNGSKYFLENSYNELTSNASFSQIELTFNETDFKSVICYAPVKSSPTAWRNVPGPLFIREKPQIRAIFQNKDGDILKQLTLLNSSNDLILDDDSYLNIYNNSVYANSPEETFLALDCNASFPVDFVYTGEGTPKIDYLPNRTITIGHNNTSDYNYSAKLKFFNVDQQIVGKYACISATREFGHRGKEENLQANINIFVPGEKLFLDSENQTFRAYQYRDSILVPCPVNDPRPNITLLKFNNETNYWYPLNSTERIDFDPLHGFSLTKNHTESLFGLYKCLGDRNRTSGVIEVYLPSDAVRVTPYLKEIKITNNETQSFTCESKENITLIFSDDPEGSFQRNVSYFTNNSSTYPYVGHYETKFGEFTNLTLINCTSTKGNKFLHTWELYPGDGQFIDQFFYDNKTAEMKCCTKSYRSPTIEWINCSSITECYTKQSSCLLQNKCQPGDYILTEGLDKSNMNNGCLAISIKERSHGLLKCVVKGIHKIVAQALVYYYNPEKDFEVHDGYFLGPKIFDKFEVLNDKVMNLSQSSDINNITIGDKVTFNCTGSRFFISSTIKWAIESTNGTFKYLNGKDLTNYEQVHSQVEIQFDNADWKAVYCIAPNWKEYYGWRNVSLQLKFFDDLVLESTTLPNDQEQVTLLPL